MRLVADEGPWRDRLRGARDLLAVRGPDFYYDLLAPAARRVDVWETEYGHVMESARAILEWVRGTGLRPFLDPLDAEERAALGALVSRLAAAHGIDPDVHRGFADHPQSQ
jgi:trans-aconitate 2-methyltransferase